MRRAVVSLLAGVVVAALLGPWGGWVDTDPPICDGLFNWYTVPCVGGYETMPAVAAGIATAGVVWLVLWLSDRSQSTR